jgi:hypothetical protein
MNQVLIGADPECFLQKVATNKEGIRHWEHLPAFGLFGGDKEKPNKMKDLPEGYAYLEDNAALEFNIPPQPTAELFCDAIDTAKGYLRNNLLVPKAYEWSHENTIKLTPKYQKDPRGQRVGCSPDHDAYLNEGAQREPFTGDSLGNQRYAGGHIHLAYNVGVIPPFVAARFLDIYLTLPWMDFDRQLNRRPVYGKAGLFRPKSYGVEYRTPSNWWVFQPPRVQEVYAGAALYFARRSYEPEYLGLLSEAYARFPWSDVQTTIQSEDREAARALVDLANQRFGLNVNVRRR